MKKCCRRLKDGVQPPLTYPRMKDESQLKRIMLGVPVVEGDRSRDSPLPEVVQLALDKKQCRKMIGFNSPRVSCILASVNEFYLQL